MDERRTAPATSGLDIIISSGAGKIAGEDGKRQELRKTLRNLHKILNALELEETAGRSGQSEPDLLIFTRRLISERSRRFTYFDEHLFSDPAWDIMLELFVAEIEGREVPVTNLCVTSNVPDTTVLRWIKTLCHQGLATRHKDKVDKRRVLVELTKSASQAMRHYVGEQLAAAERTQHMIQRNAGAA